MIDTIEILIKTRKHLLSFISELTVEELNEVPSGFNNNIIWNLAHLVASQQGVCYLRAGLKLSVDEKFYLAYKPDTRPQHYINTKEVETIKQLLISTIDQFKSDYENKLFSDYVAWTNRYGIQLASIDDTIAFLPFHEGLHLGYIMALKRLVKIKKSSWQRSL